MKFTILGGRILLSILTMVVFGTAFAQGDEVIVTGSRISDYESDNIPFVHLKKTPDFMIQQAYVESDSRDFSVRRKEVNATLKALVAKAKSNKSVELALLKTFETDDDEIEYLVPFLLDDVELSTGGRPDTTRVYLTVKTPVGGDELDPEIIEERLDGFISSIPKTGRAVVKPYGSAGLSIVDIQQYRVPLLAKIAEDNATLKSLLGSGYGIEISGLEHLVRWRVTGPLQLTLYFPYESTAKSGG